MVGSDCAVSPFVCSYDWTFVWFAVLLLVPTRELALQTSQVCKELAKHLNIQIMVTTGGTSLRDDIMRLYQPVHLLVGTPGRVLDLANKGVCNLRECTMLVMDEVSPGYKAVNMCCCGPSVCLMSTPLCLWNMSGLAMGTEE